MGLSSGTLAMGTSETQIVPAAGSRTYLAITNLDATNRVTIGPSGLADGEGIVLNPASVGGDAGGVAVFVFDGYDDACREEWYGISAAGTPNIGYIEQKAS